jgi:hypothetical protein
VTAGSLYEAVADRLRTGGFGNLASTLDQFRTGKPSAMFLAL